MPYFIILVFTDFEWRQFLQPEVRNSGSNSFQFANDSSAVCSSTSLITFDSIIFMCLRLTFFLDPQRVSGVLCTYVSYYADPVLFYFIFSWSFCCIYSFLDDVIAELIFSIFCFSYLFFCRLLLLLSRGILHSCFIVCVYIIFYVFSIFLLSVWIKTSLRCDAFFLSWINLWYIFPWWVAFFSFLLCWFTFGQYMILYPCHYCKRYFIYWGDILILIRVFVYDLCYWFIS